MSYQALVHGCRTIVGVGAFVLAASCGAVPQPQTQNGIPYLSGGVGKDEADSMRALATGYNLHLTFASQQGGEYLSDVKVTVRNAKGQVVLDTVSGGPMLMATLPAGRYRVTVESQGKAVTKSVNLSTKSGTDLNFYWPDTDSSNPRVSSAR
jgi:hypothetical protein